MTKIESERLTRSILKDLKNKTWPTDCTIKRKAVKAYIQNVQNQTLIVKKKCQLNFISSHFFNIKNRIFAIDSIFNESKSRSYNQVGFRTSTSKVYKFILLNQTKLSNLSKLPQHKVILVEIPRTNNHKKSLCLSMPVDKILQCMFLNFLDVIIEDKLKSNVFAFRKGRNARMAAAAVYFKLSQAQYLEQICVCSIKIKKCFDTIRHDKILEHYWFPKDYKFLLVRWLTPTFFKKNQKFKNWDTKKCGIPQNFILGPNIVNFMLSNAIPKKKFKEKSEAKQQLWCQTFSYTDNIVVVSNNPSIFCIQLNALRKNIKKIGLFFNDRKTKIFLNIKKEIKIFFLGFEFSVKPKKSSKKNFLFSNKKYFHSMKKFIVLIQPQLRKVKNVKIHLKRVIKKILYQSRKKIFKSFQQINSILSSWGSYYYFNQGCNYGKKIDNYVFKYLRKILVKKFRYNGLLRPKWVAYNFLGLNKKNPNNRKWQPQILQYVKHSWKTAKHVYLWTCSDSFLRLSITSFFLHSNLHKKNYYAFRSQFNKNTNKLITKRLKYNLKIHLNNK